MPSQQNDPQPIGDDALDDASGGAATTGLAPGETVTPRAPTGGINVALGDGSVRFLKATTESL